MTIAVNGGADGVKAVSRRRRWRASASLEASRSEVYVKKYSCSPAIDCGPMEERATCPHSNALSGTSGSGIAAGQKKAADLTGLPVPIISKLVGGLTHMARTNIDKRSRLLSAAVELTYQNGFEATSFAAL